MTDQWPLLTFLWYSDSEKTSSDCCLLLFFLLEQILDRWNCPLPVDLMTHLFPVLLSMILNPSISILLSMSQPPSPPLRA